MSANISHNYVLPVGLMLMSSSMSISPMEDRELRFLKQSSTKERQKAGRKLFRIYLKLVSVQ